MVVITIEDNEKKQLEIDIKCSKMSKIEDCFVNSFLKHIKNIKKDIDKIIND